MLVEISTANKSNAAELSYYSLWCISIDKFSKIVVLLLATLQDKFIIV